VIGTIAATEYRMLMRDGRIALTVSIVVVMLLVALASAAQRFGDISAERATSQEIVNAQFAAQGDKNPHAAAHYGVYAFRPVTPLSFFDTGVSSFQGVSVWLEAHRQNRAENRPAEDMTELARFGELTVAYTLQILLPLLVVLLGFPAFAGDREQGTLRQVMSMGARPVDLLFGKALGAAGAIATALGPVFVLGILALIIAPDGSDYIVHSFVLALAYCAYGAVFLFLTLAVSAYLPQSKPVLVAMIGFWAVVAFVIPRLAADVSALMQPTPPAVTLARSIETDLTGGLDGRMPDAVILERREQTLKLYGKDRIEDLPINFQGIVFSIQEQLGNEVFDLHYGALNGILDAQQNVHEVFGLLSPVLPLRLISMELSGTSLSHQLSFTNQAENYRREFIEQMNQDITYNSSPGQADYRAGADLWEKVRPFEYEQPTLTASLSRLGPALMVLFLWLAAAVLAAVIAARRLKVMMA
jgi:ABC-2 type transport system permease protein